jgi:acetoin utilization protein AcuB
MNRSHRTRATPAARLTPESLPLSATVCLPTARHAIAQFMTASSHSVGREQPLEAAHEMMRRHSIRDLPVLEGGKLAGILSQRDLDLAESIGGVYARTTTVDEAMSRETYSVRPETPVEEVAVDIADGRYGCAVVMDAGHVVGVLTTTDALRALATLPRRV